MAMINRPKSGFYIGVTCPGCGGKLDLQEDFFVLKCSHCGSILRVVMPDTPPAYYIEPKKQPREIRFLLDRHLKEQGRPLTQADFGFDRIYYPYWKVDGIRLKMQGEIPHQSQLRPAAGILTTQMDYSGMFQMGRAFGSFLNEPAAESSKTENDEPAVNLTPFHASQTAGPDYSGIPFSLGMRTDYIKILPYRQSDLDEEFQYLPVTKPWGNILAAIGGKRQSRGLNHADPDFLPGKTILLPRGSVVYFPYFICRSGGQRLVMDGLSGRVVHEAPVTEEDSEDYSSPDMQFGELNVILHRCPTCGVDLPVTQSQVYICRNCETIVSLDRNLPLEGKICQSRGKSDKSEPIFPFWVFTVPQEIVTRISRLAVLEQSSDKLIVPAFRISNFKVMRNLTQRVTAAYTHFPLEPVESFNKNFRSVDIGLNEALTMAEICLFCELAARNPRTSLSSVSLQPQEIGLFYAPFKARNYFYTDSVIDTVSFARNAVAS